MNSPDLFRQRIHFPLLLVQRHCVDGDPCREVTFDCRSDRIDPFGGDEKNRTFDKVGQSILDLKRECVAKGALLR